MAWNIGVGGKVSRHAVINRNDVSTRIADLSTIERNYFDAVD